MYNFGGHTGRDKSLRLAAAAKKSDWKVHQLGNQASCIQGILEHRANQRNRHAITQHSLKPNLAYMLLPIWHLRRLEPRHLQHLICSHSPRLLIQKPPVLARVWLKVRLTSMPKVAYFWLQPMSMATGTFRGSMPSLQTFRKAAKVKALALSFFGSRPGRSAACIGPKASDNVRLPSFLGHLKGLLQESLRIATMKSLCRRCATA